MSDLAIPGRSGDEPPKSYVLDVTDRDIIRLALRGDGWKRRAVSRPDRRELWEAWYFIYLRHSRVSGFYFALRYID